MLRAALIVVAAALLVGVGFTIGRVTTDTTTTVIVREEKAGPPKPPAGALCRILAESEAERERC